MWGSSILSLTGMDGYQVATRIREEPHGRGMLLLALTGDGVPGAHPSSSRAFDYHLVKPVDPDHLVRLLMEGAEGMQGSRM